jgi:AAA domain-containing protein
LIEATSLEERKPFDRLLAAIVGVEKSGKSRLAATAEPPVLIHDFDGRADSLAGKKGVFALTYRDVGGVNQPSAFTDFLDILHQLENTKDLSRLVINGVRAFPHAQSGTMIRTNVLDSIQWMAKAAMRYNLYAGAKIKSFTREMSVGQITVRFPGGFDSWNAEMAALEECILRVFALKTHVLVTLHEQAEEAPGSTAEKPVYTGRVNIFPARYQRLLGLFNEVWRVSRGVSMDGKASGSIPIVKTTPTYDFAYGASAMLLDAEEEPNIYKMIQKHLVREKDLLEVTQHVFPSSYPEERVEIEQPATNALAVKPQSI